MPTLYNLEISGLSKPEFLDVDRCLKSDDFIDSNHPDIQSTAEKIVENATDNWGKAKAVFNFIQSEIIYDFAPLIQDKADFKASSVLNQRSGMCHQKSNLQAALYRALGIPAALTYQKIVDVPLMASRFKTVIPDGVLPYHALTVVYLDGKWFRLDATLDRGLSKRRGYRVTDVKKNRETLLPKTKENGEPHFKIVEEHGFFESYDPSFIDTFLRHKSDWEDWRKFVRREHLSM